MKPSMYSAAYPRLQAVALLCGAFGAGAFGLGVPGAPVHQARAATAGANVPTLPVKEVRAGMTGYGLTVFKGQTPERFAVRVVGVLHHFLPKQDIILIQSDDPRLLHGGVAAGMSGSPIFLEGRLAGALAYGWPFSKDPIAGVTPIENMLEELRRPRRGRERTPLAQAEDLATRERFAAVSAALQDQDLAGAAEHRGDEPLRRLLTTLMPTSLPRPSGAGGQLLRAALPLSVSGLSAGAFSSLSEALAPYHLTPLQAGGAAPSKPSGPARFEPGGAVAVQLTRGDVSMAGTGTVTYVEGNRIAAFGHPMLNIGEVYFPIATAEIHHIFASQSNSFKMSSPLRTVGSLTQDRQSCIIGDTTEPAEMIPVRVRIVQSGQAAAPERSFTTEIARHRFLSPLLTTMVATSAVQATASDMADAVIQLRSRVGLRGFEPLTQTDFLFSPEGLSTRSVMTSTGIRQLSELLFNPFAPARIDQIDLDIQVDYRTDIAAVDSLSLASHELEPGTTPSLYVTLRPYNGQPYVRAIPFEVPRALAGQTLKIEASAGHTVKPEAAPPESLGDLVALMRKGYSSRTLVVTLTTPDEGVMFRGALIPSLPGSVIATLRPGASTKRADPYKRLSRFTVDMGGVVQGRQELTVRVREERR